MSVPLIFVCCMSAFYYILQVLVQVGDVLDRGGDEIAILSLLKWLNVQAQLTGGAVFQVLIDLMGTPGKVYNKLLVCNRK